VPRALSPWGCILSSIFSLLSIYFVIADDDGKLNLWMLAMIGISGVFIAFVGVSIYSGS